MLPCIRGGVDDIGNGDRPPFELHFAARDARDVEQVVDQPGHVLRLPANHSPPYRPTARRRVTVPEPGQEIDSV